MALAIGFVVASGLLLAWMLTLVRDARRTLPAGALVPVHRGLGRWDRWWPKDKALRTWSGFAIGIWLVNVAMMAIVVTAESARDRDAADLVAGLLLLPMVIVLVSEHFALRAAASRAAAHPTR